MRLSQVENKRGSVVVLFILMTPMAMLMMASVVWIGELVYTRARLQIAADRAAYAAAASLANSLNKLAEKNRDIHRAYKDLDEMFRGGAQQNDPTVKQETGKYEARKELALNEISNELSSMGEKAKILAYEMISKNAPLADSSVSIVGETWLNEAEKGKTSYSYITGTIFTDPTNVKSGEYEALKYLDKEIGQSAVVVETSQTIKPILFSSAFDERTVTAASVAQAYGGSVRKFAEEMDEGSEIDNLYRQTFIPLSAIGFEDAMQ